MTKTKLNLIAAACENMGIGINGTLPWRLKSEMSYFTRMTTKVRDASKVNAVIMGRVTWDCIPVKYRPLDGRLNVVLTRNVEHVKNMVPDGVVVVSGLDEAIRYIEGRHDVESTWVIGGSAIYKEAMNHPNCGKIYLTEIQQKFDCDTFFPSIGQEFHLVSDEEVPGDRQVENDISYYFRVYTKLANYPNGPKVSMYQFPKDEEVKLKWLKNISRENFTPSKSSRICKQHFQDSDVMTETKVIIPLELKHLKKSAVPSVFKEYMANKENHSRESREEKMHKKEAQQLHRVLRESIADNVKYEELLLALSRIGY